MHTSDGQRSDHEGGLFHSFSLTVTPTVWYLHRVQGSQAADTIRLKHRLQLTHEKHIVSHAEKETCCFKSPRFCGFFCILNITHLLSVFYEVTRFIWNQSPCYEPPDRYYTGSVPTSKRELCWPHGTGRRRRNWILSSLYLQMVGRSTFSPCPSLIFRTGQVSCLNRQKEAWCAGPV